MKILQYLSYFLGVGGIFLLIQEIGLDEINYKVILGLLMLCVGLAGASRASGKSPKDPS
jgi:hypothetical protein